MDKTREEGHSMIKIIEVTLGEEILEEHRIIEVRILEVDRGNFRNDNIVKGRSKSGERQYPGNFRRSERSSSRSRSGSRASTNRDSIRCFKCRGYNHFAKDCPNISYAEK